MSQSRFDPYEILGVTKTSSPEEIKRAFQKLIPQYHQDTRDKSLDPAAADEKCRNIIIAFNILRDAENTRRFNKEIRDTTTSAVGYYTQVLNLRPDEQSLLERMEGMWSHKTASREKPSGLDIKIRYKATNIETNPAEERHYYFKFDDKGYVDLHSLLSESGSAVSLDQSDLQNVLILRELVKNLEGLSYAKSEFDHLGKSDETFGQAAYFSDKLANFLLSRRYQECRENLKTKNRVPNPDSREFRYWSIPLDSGDDIGHDVELYLAKLSRRETYKEAPLAQNHYDEAPLVVEGQQRRSGNERIRFG